MAPRPSNKPEWGLDGSIVFRDSITRPHRHLPSRSGLDDRRLHAYRAVSDAVKDRIRHDLASKTGHERVGTLKEACIGVLAEELLFGHLPKQGHADEKVDEDNVAGTSMEDNALAILWDDETSRPRLPDPLAASLLERILAFLPHDDPLLPYGLFLAFVRVYLRSDIVFDRSPGPSRARRRHLLVYPALVLSDALELAQLGSLGSPRPDPVWGTLPHFPCLTILDLSFMETWRDDDMHSLKHSVGTTLAWLALEGTQVTDTGIGHLCRGFHYEDPLATRDDESDQVVHGETVAERMRRLGPTERFCRLQAVTLRGRNDVTDKGIAKLAALPSIRLIDVRGTACTSAARWVLSSRLAKPVSGAPAVLFTSASSIEDRRLFSPSYTFSHRLTLLRRRVGLQGVRIPETDPRARSIKVLIDQTERRAEAAGPIHPDRRALIGAGPAPKNAHYARSTTYGAVYTTAPIDSRAVSNDAVEENARGAAFRVHKHSLASSSMGDSPDAVEHWRSEYKRQRRRRDGEEVVSEDEEAEGADDLHIEVPPEDHGLILRLHPLSLKPARPPSAATTSGVHPSKTGPFNPAKARRPGNAPRDAEQLILKAPAKRPLDDLLGFGTTTSKRRPGDTPRGSALTASTMTQSTAPTRSFGSSSTGSPACRPSSATSTAPPKGRLSVATSKSTGWGSSLESRAKSSFFRR